MKRLLYFVVSASISLISIISCTNLTSEIYDVINPGIFPKNESDAKSLVTSAAYGPFHSKWGAIYTAAAHGLHVFTEMTTDLGDCMWDNPYWPDVINVHFIPNSDLPTSFYWRIKQISTMTLTIDRINNIPMNDKMKARLVGELRCGRGWLAYLLYDLYGPVPIATLEQLNNPLGDEIIPRPTKEWMVEYIQADLMEAIKVLPANYKKGDADYGRFTGGLAYTVLMKLYMHEGNWKKAIECGRELMKPVYGYQLQEHYKDIFTLENEKNSEIIWAVQCDLATDNEMWQAHVIPSQYPTKNPNIQKWGGYRMPWAFYHTFDKNDERLEVLIGDFMGVDGKRYNEENPGYILVKGAIPIKVGEDPMATGENSQIDWVVYRYADVLTLLAEAIVRDENKITQEAVNLLNMIRIRAGIAPYKLTDFTGVNDFLDKVLLNRGQELWFEDCRRTDLIRYGKYIEYARKYKGSNTAEDYMVLMPLPQWAIDEGKGKVIQNPGY